MLCCIAMADNHSRPVGDIDVESLLDFVERHPTRQLDRQTAGWIIEKIGHEEGRLLVADAGGRYQLVASLFVETGSSHRTAELMVIGYRATADGARRFRDALAWAEQRAADAGAHRLEVSLPPALAELAPVTCERGYQSRYRLLWLVLDGITRSPWLDVGPPAGFAWSSLAADNVASAHRCYARAFASVPGAQVVSCELFRSMMLAAEQRPRVLLADGRVMAYVRIVWHDEAARRGEVRSIACDPDAQGRGLGKAALAEALRELQRMGAVDACLEVASENERAIRLYERFGFATRQITEVCSRDLAGA